MGFLVVALLAVVGTVLASLLVGVVWPSGPFTYLLVGSTVGLGVGAVAGVAAVARHLDRRPFADYAFRGGRAWWRDAAVGLAPATMAQAAVLGVGFAAVVAVVAVTLAAGYVLTGRLGLAVGFHNGWNVALGVPFGLPVSGMAVPARALVVEVTGPAAWTGGAFGPEAGLLDALAGLAGLVAVLAYVRLVEGRLRVHPTVFAPTLRRDVHGVPPADAGGVPDSDPDLTEVGAARERVESRS